MAQHVWTVLCDKVLRDNESPNTISLIQVVERLTLRAPSLRRIEDLIRESQEAGDKGILVTANMRLVSWWVRSDYSKEEMSRFRYAIINPGGKRIDEQFFPLNLLHSVGQRVVCSIIDWPLSSLGLHWIVIEEEVPQQEKKEEDWNAVARLPLEVIEEGAPSS